ADNHVLRLGLNITAEGLEAIQAGEAVTLNIPYVVAHNSGRRILAWTNLSGSNVEDITFATTANLLNKRIGITNPVLASGTTSASIALPKELFYNTVTGRTATTLYIIMGVDAGEDGTTDRYTQAGENRGGSSRNNVNGVNLAAEFDIFKEVILTGLILCSCDGGGWLEETYFTHINIAPGANPLQLGFSWFTPRDFSRTAALQFAKVSDLVDGQMPPNARQFTAVNSPASSLYDSNKVTVTGLEPDTAYAYRVGAGAVWSNNIFTFNTQNPNHYQVIVIADPQIGASSESWERTLRRAVRSAPDAAFIISAGDQVDYANRLNEVDGYVNPPQLRSYPVKTTVGNHDNDLDPAFELVGYMALIYQWPNDGMKAAQQTGGWNYYFSYGNTLYISINSNEKDIEIHRAFMKQAVASHPNAVWRVATFHHDIYGVGDHAGTGYGDSAAMQADWSPFLDEFEIDVAFNGHDHIYARSKFIRGDEIQKLQMTAIFDQNLNQANPGAVILPDGIQYMALSTAGDKFYNPEYQNWVAYTPGRLGNPGANPPVPDVTEYTIMTIDGTNLILETFRVDTNELLDSIILRKTALREDLAAAIPGAKAVQRGDILEPGWTTFQTAIAAAEAVLAAGPPQVIHDTFVALYDTYFQLRVPTNKLPLENLIDQVANKLLSATEGRWEGQYPLGSIAELRGVLNTAIPVYETRLATQRATDDAYNALNAAFRDFESRVSAIPIPWIFVHNILAQGVTTIDLIDWMDDSRSFAVGNETKYFTHHTKQDFAKDNFGGPRSEPVFGPANGLGGRGHNNAHITKTNIGEWIRYELNVTRAGSYRVRLGAVNNSNVAQRILLRDANFNTLASFTVPANRPLTAAGWNGALMVDADREIYLPAGNYVIELFFVNDGLNVNTRDQFYPDGADVDILTFERTGDGAAPRVIADPAIYRLPIPPLIAAGAPIRQQGWGTTGAVSGADENQASNFGAGREGVPVEVFKAATHLALELASPVTGSMQIQIQSDATMDWNQSEFSSSALERYWDGQKLVIPMRDLVNYDRWVTMQSSARLFVSYYNYGWNELNVMGAYFIIDPAKYQISSIDSTSVTAPAATSPVITPAAPLSFAEVERIIENAAAGTGLNWRTSTVDLLRALGLDSGISTQTDISNYLGYRGAAAVGSAEHAGWLYTELMNMLAMNEGRVPRGLLEILWESAARSMR
ncbi:MAG: DUF3597 family protein, partial [Treponema sp.]|nr:DUF3597 family protein [Treponema sp.]